MTLHTYWHWLRLSIADWHFRLNQRPVLRQMTLLDVVVAPIEEMLMRWAGGSIWRGGPQAPLKQPCSALNHYRGNQPVSDPARTIEGAASWPLENGRMFWCGPIVNHFGHQLGEFGGRVLMASLDPQQGCLLFLHSEPNQSLETLLPWQQAWIRFLNPCQKPVVISSGRFRAKELVIVPQHQRLGRPPTPAYLQALTKRGQALSHTAIDQILVLSRTHFAPGIDSSKLQGSVAGEREFDSWMESQGAQIIYPEQWPLDDQLQHLHNARRLVLAEGSALHALELIGFQPSKQVVVIARRPLWKGMDRALRSRFPRLLWIDAVEELWWMPPFNPRVKGIARLNWRIVMNLVSNYFDLDVNNEDIKTINNKASQQIKSLLAQASLHVQHCTEKDRRPERDGGW